MENTFQVSCVFGGAKGTMVRSTLVDTLELGFTNCCPFACCCLSAELGVLGGTGAPAQPASARVGDIGLTFPGSWPLTCWPKPAPAIPDVENITAPATTALPANSGSSDHQKVTSKLRYHATCNSGNIVMWCKIWWTFPVTHDPPKKDFDLNICNFPTLRPWKNGGAMWIHVSNEERVLRFNFLQGVY